MMAPGNPRDLWEEDIRLDLPGNVSLDEEEESYTPDDDSDLGLPGSEVEEVGLDADAGLDEPLEGELELDDADEGERFSDATEAGDDLEDEVDLIAGAEDGWTLDNDTPEDLELEDEVGDLDELGTGDAGEEGFEDDSIAAELGLPDRPARADDDPELDLPPEDLEIETPLPVQGSE